MSRENVTTIGRSYEALARGDLEALFALCDADIALEVSDAYLDAPRTYRGREGMLELFAAQAEIFDPFRIEVEELLDAGDRVLAVVQAGGLARTSGVEVFGRFGHLWTLRASKLAHVKEYKDVGEARDAAGFRNGRRRLPLQGVR